MKKEISVVEKIAEDAINEENKHLIEDFEHFIKQKGDNLGFHGELALIEYLLYRNNKRRTNDIAFISFKSKNGNWIL